MKLDSATGLDALVVARYVMPRSAETYARGAATPLLDAMAVGVRCEIALQPRLRPMFDVAKQLYTAHKIGIVCGEADSLAAAQSTQLRHRRLRMCSLLTRSRPHWAELT